MRRGRVEFATFHASLFMARLADQMLLFLVPLLVYRTTGSAAWSGMAFFAESLPRFIAFPVCGALCDRYSPMVLLQRSQAWRALTCLVMMLGWYLLPAIVWLILLSAVCGVLTTQGFMAREVMLPRLFPGRRFETVLSHAQAAEQAGMVLGPLLAAVLLQRWPWPLAVAIAAALFLAADAATHCWRRAGAIRFEAAGGERGHLLMPMVTALRHIGRVPELRRLIVLACGVNLIVGVTLATSAAMAVGGLHASQGDYALLQTVGAVATIVVLLGIARAAFSLASLGLVAYLAILVGAILTAGATNLAAYGCGFVLIVGFDKMFNIYLRSLRQRVIPPRDFGKTAGVVTLLNNLPQPLAGLLVGVSAGRVGLPALIFALAACMAGVGIGVAWWRRSAQ